MHIRAICILLLLVVTISFALLAYPAEVHAANITVLPTVGTVGTSIVITGTGFTGHWATVYWGNQIILTKVPISVTGELKCELKVPPASRGNHTIKIVDNSGQTGSTASTTFTVLPQITVFPSIGGIHAQVTVTGTGFYAFEKDIKIIWDDSVLPTSTTASHLGTWSIDFNIPETTKDDHYISAFGSSTKASEVGKVKFMVAPAVKIWPLSGHVNTEIRIDGFGFRTGEDGITITWDGEIILCNIVGGADGSWSTTLVIPPSTQGLHTIGVYGSSFTPKGVVPDTKFTVIPHMELKPSSGSKGTKVTVTGTGFAKDETITISFNETRLDLLSVADDTGSFNATFVVPPTTIKDNKITATGNKGSSAQAIFIAEKMAPPAPNLLAPESGARMTVFTSVGDVFTVVGKQLIDIISFSGQQSTNNQQLTFDWSDSGKPGEISYVLEVARRYDFLSPDLVKENLTNSGYTLHGGDTLSPGSYIWRVKAIDNIGNESPWSEIGRVEIISMSRQVYIISLLTLVLFVVAIVVAAIMGWRLQRAKR